MKTTRDLKVCLAVSLMLACSAWSQTPRVRTDAITFDGVELRLGLSKEAVVSQLSTLYNLVRLTNAGASESDDWLINSKESPTASYGQVSFSKGKLVLIAKDWTPSDNDSTSFAQMLFGVLDQFGKEDRHECLVNTNATHTPNMNAQVITMFCGAKRLNIEITEMLSGAYKGKSASIQELLISDPTQPRRVR